MKPLTAAVVVTVVALSVGEDVRDRRDDRCDLRQDQRELARNVRQ